MTNLWVEKLHSTADVSSLKQGEWHTCVPDLRRCLVWIINEWTWFVHGMCTITGKYCKPLKSLSTGTDPPVFTQTKFPPLPCLNTTVFVVQVYRGQSEGRGEGERCCCPCSAEKRFPGGAQGWDDPCCFGWELPAPGAARRGSSSSGWRQWSPQLHGKVCDFLPISSTYWGRFGEEDDAIASLKSAQVSPPCSMWVTQASPRYMWWLQSYNGQTKAESSWNPLQPVSWRQGHCCRGKEADARQVHTQAELPGENRPKFGRLN